MASDKAPLNPLVFTYKEFGAAYFVRNVPNAYERMWMVARAINFDIDNYNKLYNIPDKAMKRRYVRNFIRFLDLPVGYIFWHSIPYLRSGTFRFLPFYFFLSFGITWWVAGSNLYHGSVEVAQEKQKEGHVLYEHPTEVRTYNHIQGLLFHESEFSMDKGLISQKAAPPYPKFCRLNTYVRDQNYRKYFAHRERRDVDLFTGRPKH